LSFSFYQPLPFLSSSFLCIYIYTPTHSFHIVSIDSFFFLLSSFSLLLDEWLIFSWRRLSLWPSFLFLLSYVQFLLSVHWLMETPSDIHFCHLGGWLHGWAVWWMNTWKVYFYCEQLANRSNKNYCGRSAPNGLVITSRYCTLFVHFIELARIRDKN
jgi:hypothetical protein